MSKQRRQRLNRSKQIRSRSQIRNGVEQLESRVLPGGFLDLLAGAAIASNFDLLPAEQLIPEEVEIESDASAPRTRAGNSLLQLGLSLPDLDHDASEERVELTPSNEPLDFATTSPATANTLLATSIVDSFFAGNQFIDTTPRPLVSPSAPLSTPNPSFSSPISQLGAGIGTGSGQGFNVTGAELPLSNVGNSVASTPSMPT
ncbi:MAG: hypothetical protein O3C40_24415 [Planctomycetota bacterium]|nr:hypothetical protein [Planctomycetota bacterium]